MNDKDTLRNSHVFSLNILALSSSTSYNYILCYLPVFRREQTTSKHRLQGLVQMPLDHEERQDHRLPHPLHKQVTLQVRGLKLFKNLLNFIQSFYRFFIVFYKVQLPQDCKVTTNKQVTFNHHVPISSQYLFDQPDPPPPTFQKKKKRLSRPWNTTYLFFNSRPLDWFCVLLCQWKDVLTPLFRCSWSFSHWRCSVKKLFLKISSNAHRNTCVGVFFHKSVGQLATLLKKRLRHRCFPVY